MLVKLAFVMQRLKKISEKIFVRINKDGGGGTIFSSYGETQAHGGPPSSPPPTRENRGDVWYLSDNVSNIFNAESTE